MNAKTFTIFVGIFLVSQGVIGFVLPHNNLGGVWNINASMNTLRMLLGIGLIICAFNERVLLKTGLFIFGAIYISIFALGIISPNLFGFAPDYIGFSGQVLRLFLGSVAIMLSIRLQKKTETE